MLLMNKSFEKKSYNLKLLVKANHFDLRLFPSNNIIFLQVSCLLGHSQPNHAGAV